MTQVAAGFYHTLVLARPGDACAREVRKCELEDFVSQERAHEFAPFSAHAQLHAMRTFGVGPERDGAVESGERDVRKRAATPPTLSSSTPRSSSSSLLAEHESHAAKNVELVLFLLAQMDRLCGDRATLRAASLKDGKNGACDSVKCTASLYCVDAAPETLELLLGLLAQLYEYAAPASRDAAEVKEEQEPAVDPARRSSVSYEQYTIEKVVRQYTIDTFIDLRRLGVPKNFERPTPHSRVARDSLSRKGLE